LILVPWARFSIGLPMASTVSMVLFCVISEVKGDIGRKSQLGDPRRNTAIPFGAKKLDGMVWLPDGEKTLRTCVTVSTEYRRVTDRRADRWTDRQTDVLRRHSPRCAMHSIVR